MAGLHICYDLQFYFVLLHKLECNLRQGGAECNIMDMVLDCLFWWK